MAERITALGGIAEGTVQAVGGRSRLDAYPLGIAEGRAHLEALAGAFARFGKSVRKAIDESGKAGDADTSDLFTGVSRDVDKSLWLVERLVRKACEAWHAEPESPGTDHDARDAHGNAQGRTPAPQRVRSAHQQSALDLLEVLGSAPEHEHVALAQSRLRRG